MATSMEEFLEILTAEMLIDIGKLKEAALHGVPFEVRGEVWKYLLGVKNADQSRDMTNSKLLHQDYLSLDKSNPEIMKRVRGEASRYQKSKIEAFTRKLKSSHSSANNNPHHNTGSNNNGNNTPSSHTSAIITNSNKRNFSHSVVVSAAAYASAASIFPYGNSITHSNNPPNNSFSNSINSPNTNHHHHFNSFFNTNPSILGNVPSNNTTVSTTCTHLAGGFPSGSPITKSSNNTSTTTNNNNNSSNHGSSILSSSIFSNQNCTLNDAEPTIITTSSSFSSYHNNINSSSINNNNHIHQQTFQLPPPYIASSELSTTSILNVKPIVDQIQLQQQQLLLISQQSPTIYPSTSSPLTMMEHPSTDLSLISNAAALSIPSPTASTISHASSSPSNMMINNNYSNSNMVASTMTMMNPVLSNGRFHGGLLKEKTDYPLLIENVLSAFFNRRRQIEYSPGLVHMCGPLTLMVVEESDMYYCFEKIMMIVDEFYALKSVHERLSNFLMLFRNLHPDLYNHFEEEEIDMQEWTTSWFQYLLAKELSIDALMRLWDTYFSMEDPLCLHTYVCLAILNFLKEGLEDLEQSEIRATLLKLPTLDMDQIIRHAFNIKQEVSERGLIME